MSLTAAAGIPIWPDDTVLDSRIRFRRAHEISQHLHISLNEFQHMPLRHVALPEACHDQITEVCSSDVSAFLSVASFK